MKSKPKAVRENARKKPAGKNAKSSSRRIAAQRETHLLSLTVGRGRTVLYVHGIGNKPLPNILKCQWDRALFGFDLGERSRLAYWVNRATYPDPWPSTCKSGDTTTVGETQPVAGRTRGMSVKMVPEPLSELVDEVAPEMPENQRAVLKRLAQQIENNEANRSPAVRTAGYGTRLLPLPGPIRRWITRGLTSLFLLDVYEYFFDKVRREVMLASVRDRLLSGGGPFVVIGHSQGSMLAYHVLYELAETHPELEIDLFVTIGSPLGLTEVQDQIKKLTKQPRGLAVPANVKRWVNVADYLDPVCADKTLDDDIASTGGVGIQDISDWNMDSPRDPHSGTGYLRMSQVREEVQASIQTDIFQRIAPFTVARDLVRQIESTLAEERHTVLIELREPRGTTRRDEDEVTALPSLDKTRQAVVDWIDKYVKAENPGLSIADLELERLNNYVSARLTRFEIERLASDLEQTSIHRVYRNAEKKALLRDSGRVVQATTAHRGYDADGRGIVWAVLDTGIDVFHPHFQTHKTIQDVYDCLQPGDPKLRSKKAAASDRTGLDRNGHGSHVAGIVAGEFSPPPGSDGARSEGISGIAPRCKIVSYKVLSDSGVGSDAKIIKALDHIFETNQRSTSLAIHGVNLSLGGSFDPQAFGCGDSPLCKRLRDLWRQGVVIVLAAGNEGFLELPVGEEEVGLNMDLSIGDPANLDEAIAVGSVHKLKPHRYGVSFFSSRGPTADGRAKPDLVAPGERILSCRAGGTEAAIDEMYVELSGTSMAAPHVSGVSACFLSARREFLGFPDKVKEQLLASCVDLKRDRMHQGAGVPNLVKMLLNS